MEQGLLLWYFEICGKYRLGKLLGLSTKVLLLTLICMLSESTGAQTRQDLELELHRLRIQDNSKRPQWSKFGSILVDWNSWRLHPNGSRTVDILKNINKAEDTLMAPIWRLQITPSPQLKRGRLAVDCKSLKTSQKRASGEWDEWMLPQASSKEEEIVLKVCAKIDKNET